MLATLLLAAAVTAVPSPPVPTQYVTDTQGVLAPQTVHSVERELRVYEKTTGHQVIVYIGSTTGNEPLEQWTVDTAERWGIGRKHHDDGAVLFILMKDHKIRIEVGYGLEPYLTDAQSFWIIENTIQPKMRAGDPNAAVQDGVDQILTTITPSFASRIGHAIASPQPRGETGAEGGGLGRTALAIVIFLAFFWVVLLMIFIAGIRYLATLFTKGPAAAAKAWHDTWISSGSRHGSMWYGGAPIFGGFGGFGGGGFGGGFSAGGGGFGGGGASGGW